MTGQCSSATRHAERPTLPTDWREIPLGDLSIKTTVGFVGSMSHLFTTSGVPLLRGTNVLTGRLDLTNLRYISVQTHRRWAKSALLADDLVIVRVGYPGTTAVIPSSLGPANAASLVIVRPDQRLLSPDYVMQVLNSPEGKARIEAQLVGGAQQVFNTALAARYRIPLPPRREQDRIADALKCADDCIAALERAVAKKQAIKQGMMQQLLTGRARLPGFSDPWLKISLGEISAFITKGATPTTYGFKWESTGVPFLRSECVSEHGLDMAQAMFISAAANQALRRSQVSNGDILMTITGYVGRVIRLAGIGGANINQHIARIRVSDQRFDGGFIYHYLSQPSVRAYYETIVTGQAYPQISLKQVRETEIPALPIKEQHAIAAILSDADQDIATSQRRLVKARVIKIGMMQQLLTGCTRLPAQETAHE